MQTLLETLSQGITTHYYSACYALQGIDNIFLVYCF